MKPIGALILAAALGACGGTEPAAPNPWLGTVTVTGGTPATVTVTFTSTGVSPASVSVPAGGSIEWVNADTAMHWPESNPHCAAPPTQHSGCPWLNIPAALSPNGQAGDRVTVGPAPAMPTTCGFHNHLHPPTCGGGGGGY